MRGLPAKERGILFSAPMVRAILAGTKTQTRRLVTARHWDPNDFSIARLLRSSDDRIGLQAFFGQPSYSPEWLGVGCPFGLAGDRLWVRETWYCDHAFAGCEDGDPAAWRRETYYRADYKDHADWARGWEAEVPPWRPSIYMPRWASRITLEITAVRVERLQSITHGDALREGRADWDGQHVYSNHPEPIARFMELWDSLNAKRAPWSSNPWVWVVTFVRLKEG